MSNPIHEPRYFGLKFIKALHYFLHTIKIHQENNQLVRESIDKLKNVLSETTGGNDIEILLWRGRLFFQGEKILYGRDSLPLFQDLLEYFTQRGFCGFHFSPSFIEATYNDLFIFARLLNESVGQPNPFSWIQENLSKSGIEWVEIQKEVNHAPSTSNLHRKEIALQTYSQAVAAIKEVTQKVTRESTAGIRKARRLAQTMVDLVTEDESLVLGLTTIREYDDYTFTHSINVALLSMCLGRRIGLSRPLLEQLGICGMFHDLGKVELPKEILMKPEKLDNDEWEFVRKHPLIGVIRILRMRASRDIKSRLILGPFEHHLNENLSGYPKIHFTKRISLFGKILRITDTYDALTSVRTYRSRPLSPDEAIQWMWRKAQVEYNSVLLKSFINLMGLYPIGTVLQLNTGEFGLVVDYANELDKSRPQILLLEKDRHGKFWGSQSLNLAQRDQKTGSYQYNIVKGLHPSVFRIQPSQLILQESA